MIDKGTEVEYVAAGGNVPHHGLLPDKAARQWSGLRKEFTAQWRASEDPLSRRRIVDLSGCLEKLEATLLQARRIREYHDRLISQARSLKATLFQGTAFQGSDACADFEGFLLHGRASLDRLTWFIGRHFKNPVSSFRRIKNVLSDFEGKSSEAAELLEMVGSADAWFDGLFGKLESPQSLRDIVAHHHALVEGTRTCFGVQRISDESALLIDCEVELPGLDARLPVLKTTNDSIGYLAFLILNSVAVFMDVERLPFQDYATTWANLGIAISDYVIRVPVGSLHGEHTLFTVRRVTPDGFEFGTDNVDPSIFERRFSL
jgi:hypothetical protein